MDPISNLKSLLNDGKVIKISNYPKHSVLNELSSQDILLYKRFNVSEIDAFLTPVEEFFIRNHLPYPQIENDKWQLKLEGCFERSGMLSIDDIMGFEWVKRVALIECTGNQRSERKITDSLKILFKYSDIYTFNKLTKILDPMEWKWTLSLLRSTGIRGGNLFGNAQFTGVRLFDVLDKYPLTEDAKEIVFEGMDKGYDTPIQRAKKEAHNFARSFEIQELRKYEPLLCFEMNDASLSIEHGWPLRLIIPGMYGAEQVKWLRRIIATSEKYKGYYQTEYYGYKINGEMVPVHEGRPKSLVIRVLKKHKRVTVYGVAWRGLSPIDRIEVSLDDMKTWNPAQLLCREIDNSWIFWRFELPQDLKGKLVIVPRIFCVNGDCQPLRPGKYSSSYGNNSVVSAVVKI